MDKKFAQAKVQSEIRTLAVGVRGEDAIQFSTLAKPNIKEILENQAPLDHFCSLFGCEEVRIFTSSQQKKEN